jgi:hypothetical protein
MGEYDSFKPADDFGQGGQDGGQDDDEGASEMGLESHAWTPRGDWARGAREHFDEETVDTFEVQYVSPVYVPGYIGVGGMPYEEVGYMHRARLCGDELECEP